MFSLCSEESEKEEEDEEQEEEDLIPLAGRHK